MGIFSDDSGNVKTGNVILAIMLGIVCLFLFFAVLIPVMVPWWAEQTGKGELAQAEQNRQIAVKEAQAKLDSSKLLAEAEIERARGVAQANKIIGESLKQNEDYLRYLFINGLFENPNQNREIIYIPTETGLPILEANRLK